jgi:hypothetical protein
MLTLVNVELENVNLVNVELENVVVVSVVAALCAPRRVLLA